MYSKEQRETALRLYDECHSVTKVIRLLGYPHTRQGMYSWIKQVPRCFVWVKKNYFPGDWRFVRYARRGYFSDGPWAHSAMAS